MAFPILPEAVLTIPFTELLAAGRISPLLFNKLTAYARLSTVGELYQQYYSADDFVDRVRMAGKRVGTELDALVWALAGDGATETVQPAAMLFADNAAVVDPIPTFNEAISAITFVSLHQKKLISNTLYNKAVRDAKLVSIGDLSAGYRSVDEFVSKLTGAGATTKIAMQRLLNGLLINPAPYLDAHQSAQGIYLPYALDTAQSLPDAINCLLTDTIQELKNRGREAGKAHGSVAEHIYVKGRTLEDTGILLHLTRERIRQVRNKVNEAFSAWFTDNKNDALPNFYVHPTLREQVNKLITELKAVFPFVAEKGELRAWLANQGVVFETVHLPAWRLFCRLAGIRQMGKTASSFTKADFYIIEPDFSKELFFVLGKLTIDALKDSVVPLPRDEVVIAVNQLVKQEAASQQKQLRKVLTGMVDFSLARLPEIEQLDQDGVITYQVHFPCLSSQADMAERVLYEAGRVMHMAELITEIQKRLRQAGIERDFDENSMRGHMLTEKKHIIHHGKSSLYAWGDPNAGQSTKTYSKIELVRKALAEANEPLAPARIVAYINAYLTQLGVGADHDPKSTSAILSYMMKQKNGVLRLRNGSYILKSWEGQYEQTMEIEPVKKVKGSILKRVLSILDEAPDKTMRRDLLFLKLQAEGYPKSTMITTLKREDLFEHIKLEGKKQVRRLPVSAAIVKVYKQDQVRDRMVTLLSSVQGNRLALSAVVNQLVSEFSMTKTQRPVVYKIVAANPSLFFKEEKEETFITLLSTPTQPAIAEAFDPDKHWKTLQTNLVTEVGDVAAVICKHNAAQVLDVFRDVAQRSADHEDLEGLCHLLDYVWNYYVVQGSEQQKYLYARAVITLMEPYLLKVLSFVNTSNYEVFMADEKKGLALLFKKLHKVDPYKQPTEGIIKLAKMARNKISHSARLWDVGKEREQVNACLLVMLHVVDCYYSTLLTLK